MKSTDLIDKIFSETDGFDADYHLWDSSQFSRAAKKAKTFVELLKGKGGSEQQVAVFREVADAVIDHEATGKFSSDPARPFNRHEFSKDLLLPELAKKTHFPIADLGYYLTRVCALHKKGAYGEILFFPVGEIVRQTVADDEAPGNKAIVQNMARIKRGIDEWKLHFKDKISAGVLIGCWLRANGHDASLFSEGVHGPKNPAGVMRRLNSAMPGSDVIPLARLVADASKAKPTKAMVVRHQQARASIGEEKLDELLPGYLDILVDELDKTPDQFATQDIVRMASRALVWNAGLSKDATVQNALRELSSACEAAGQPGKGLLSACSWALGQ